jgi:hypothetical protein
MIPITPTLGDITSPTHRRRDVCLRENMAEGFTTRDEYLRGKIQYCIFEKAKR